MNLEESIYLALIERALQDDQGYWGLTHPEAPRKSAYEHLATCAREAASLLKPAFELLGPMPGGPRTPTRLQHVKYTPKKVSVEPNHFDADPLGTTRIVETVASPPKEPATSEQDDFQKAVEAATQGSTYLDEEPSIVEPSGDVYDPGQVFLGPGTGPTEAFEAVSPGMWENPPKPSRAIEISQRIIILLDAPEAREKGLKRSVLQQTIARIFKAPAEEMDAALAMLLQEDRVLEAVVESGTRGQPPRYYFLTEWAPEAYRKARPVPAGYVGDTRLHGILGQR